MKILFTAGTQFAFPRMARVVDKVARAYPDWELAFQAGPGASRTALPEVVGPRVERLFDGAEFESLFQAADLIVTHAGMGNIMACLEQGKPFLMMPRQARLLEHRNNHQLDTARAISRAYQVPVFHDVESLTEAVLSFRVAPKPIIPCGNREEIDRQRQGFAKRLNALIQQL